MGEEHGHICSERERLMNLERRLGDGDVTLATMHQTQLLILDQVQKTNGRVSALERFKQAFLWCVLGIMGLGLAQSVGLVAMLAEVIK